MGAVPGLREVVPVTFPLVDGFLVGAVPAVFSAVCGVSSVTVVSSAGDDEETVVLSALNVCVDGCPPSEDDVVVGEQPTSKTAADRTAASRPSPFLLPIFLSHPFRVRRRWFVPDGLPLQRRIPFVDFLRPFFAALAHPVLCKPVKGADIFSSNRYSAGTAKAVPPWATGLWRAGRHAFRFVLHGVVNGQIA